MNTTQRFVGGDSNVENLISLNEILKQKYILTFLSLFFLNFFSCFPFTFLTLTESVGNTTCNVCENGRFAADIAQDRCFECPAGFQDTNEKNRCDSCLKGTYQPAPQATLCLDCEDGKYAADISMQFCTDCPAGWEDTNEKNRCDSCPKGTYQANPKSTDCIACENGKFAADISLPFCTACPAGWEDTDERNRCDSCPKGTYQLNPESTDCIVCADGSIAKELMSLSCTNCLAGFFESKKVECKGCNKGFFQGLNEGATECKICPSGWFAAEERESECEMCPKGFMEPGQQINCQACGKGRYQANEGGIECKACENGRYADNEKRDACQDCQVGKWRQDTGKCTHKRTMSCTTTVECQAEIGDKGTSVCISGETCLSCNEGTYQSLMGQIDCLNCPIGFYQKLRNKDFCNSCEMGRFQTKEFVDTPKDSFIFNDGKEYGGLGGLASDCQFCPSGYQNALTNSSSCMMCEIGKYIGCKGGYKCWDCDPGRTSFNPVTKKAEGGTECIAETVITSVPMFIESTHTYGCNASNAALVASNLEPNSKLMLVPNAKQQNKITGYSSRNPDHLLAFEALIGLTDSNLDDCRVQNISVMCVTWKTNDITTRKEEQGECNEGVASCTLPYKYTGGFFVEWSTERNFPPRNDDDFEERIKTNQSHLMHAGALDWVLPENPEEGKCEAEVDDDSEKKKCAEGYFKEDIEEMHLGPWTYCFETTEPVHVSSIAARY